MRLIAQIMTEITRKPRERFDYPFTDSWVDNIFIAYYKIFWRRVGIRKEMMIWSDKNGNMGRLFYTWRSYLIYQEHVMRSFFRRIATVRVIVPVMVTPNGIPVFASPYIFAIALGNEKDSQTPAANLLTIGTIVVASGTTLIACVQTNASNTNTPITGVTWNVSENMSLVKTDFNTTSTKVTEDLWQIAAPTATTASVIATSSHNPETNFYGTALTYSGTSTAGVMSNAASNKGNSVTTETVTVTGTTNTSWLIGGVIVASSGTTDSTGFTHRNVGGPSVGDSNGAIAGGSVSMNTTSPSDNYVFVAGELTIPGSGVVTTPTHYLNLLGIGS